MTARTLVMILRSLSSETTPRAPCGGPAAPG